MATKIEMPKLSDTMTEGTVVRWLKKVGEQVEIGDEIAEIETDKATMAMEAFDEGILSEILIEEGGKAEIGATLAVLREEGEEPPAKEESAPAKTEPEPEPAEEAEPEAKSEEQETDQQPAAKPPETGAGGGGKEAQSKSDSPAATPPPSSAKVAEPKERIKASPLARKIAEEAGIDLGAVTGTGPGGRIVKKDVEAAASASGSGVAESQEKAPPASAPAAEPSGPEKRPAAAPSRATVAPAPAAEGDKKIELSNLRRIIAERLLTSKTTIPHFYLHVEADAAPLMDLRRQINAQAEASHGNKYTINDFVLKAVINALQAVPAANAAFNGDHIVQYGHIGIAVAVAVEDGLVTPVVKDAASKSLLQISREVKDLAARAREGKLHPNEFDGGTFTVSNLGAYGVEFFDAIINPPQAAILSVGAIVEKPVVVDGAVVPGLRMNLGVSGDHRIVDGAVGAKLLGEIKKLIENPALMLV